MADKARATIKRGGYKQGSIRDRLLAFFRDNIGKVVAQQQLVEVARDPITGKDPENWHQRLSELRTDLGYTILASRDQKDLKVGEYLMPHLDRRAGAAKRVRPTSSTWETVLERAGHACEWREGKGAVCGLRDGDADPVGGGTVRLTPDHKTPHAMSPRSDPTSADAWQALCGRHQVTKKNLWDTMTGKLNISAIIQAASNEEKRLAYELLKRYFGEE
jgi:hypothetical protein